MYSRCMSQFRFSRDVVFDAIVGAPVLTAAVRTGSSRVYRHCNARTCLSELRGLLGAVYGSMPLSNAVIIAKMISSNSLVSMLGLPVGVYSGDVPGNEMQPSVL